MLQKPLKIYFFGSINGGTQDIEPWYRPLILFLNRFGLVLSTDIFFKPEIIDGNEHGTSDHEIFARDVGFVDEADVLIGEVTIPSTGVGYELGRAHAQGKPILCLHRSAHIGRRLTAMVAGNTDIHVRHYTTLEEAHDHILAFFKHLGIEA